MDLPSNEELRRGKALQLAIMARGPKVDPKDIIETAKLFFKYLSGEDA